MRGTKSGSESGRTERQKFNTWNSDRCHSLHNSSFSELSKFAAYKTDKTHRVQVKYFFSG